VFPVRYELGFYNPEDILHIHRREILKSYMNRIKLINLVSCSYEPVSTQTYL
jgi:hypothetical protein